MSPIEIEPSLPVAPPYNPNRRKTKEQWEREALLRKQREEYERYCLAHAAEWKEERERAYAASLRESGAENVSPYERSLLDKYPPEVVVEDNRADAARRVRGRLVSDDEEDEDP